MNFKDLFKASREITQEDFSNLWVKGFFIFDTNVLHDLYRLPISAKNDLLKILNDKKINSRIWLPFQVAFEFNNNRTSTIYDQKNKFKEVKKIFNDSINSINTINKDIRENLDKLQLKKRHSVIDPDQLLDESLFASAIQKIESFLEDLNELDKKVLDINEPDPLFDTISNIFENKFGDCPTQEVLDNYYIEGEKRFKDQIPPGYKDATKTDEYIYAGKTFKSKFGDLIIWNEIIEKITKDNIEYAVFITGDTKEDWWEKSKGKTIGPRKELLEEIYHKAKNLKLFHMYDTSRFIKYASEFLAITIKEESIDVAKDLIELSSTENKEFQRYNLTNLYDALLKTKNEFEKGQIVLILSPSIHPTYWLLIPPFKLEKVFFQLTLLVLQSSLGNDVFIDFSISADNVTISFEGSVVMELYKSAKINSIIKEINRSLAHFGIIHSFILNDNVHALQLLIKSEFFNTSITSDIEISE